MVEQIFCIHDMTQYPTTQATSRSQTCSGTPNAHLRPVEQSALHMHLQAKAAVGDQSKLQTYDTILFFQKELH